MVLIGRSNIVGMPMYLLLNKYDAFVTVCFSKTSEAQLSEAVSQADIVIAACGVPGLIKASWVKADSVVVDVGINFVELANDQDKKQSVLCGDVQFNQELLSKVKAVTPVPGGVGPMTITMLLSNLVESWEHSIRGNAVGQESLQINQS